MITVIEDILRSEPEKSLSCEAQYTLNPDVILLLISDKTGRLLDLGGYFFAVSATGTEMLQEVLERDTASASTRIATRYGIEVQQVKRDLESFLGDLKKQGLIYQTNSRQQTFSIKRYPALFILSPILSSILFSDRSLKTKVWTLLTVAYISITLFGWAKTIRVWQSYYHQESKILSRQDSKKIIEAIDEKVRTIAAKHLLNIGCKERALCCWTLIRSYGLPVKLVLGVDLFPLASHCWCEFGSEILTDYSDRCERFTPILSYE